MTRAQAGPSPGGPSTKIVLLAALFALELSAILAAFAWHKKDDRSLALFLQTPTGVVFGACLIVLPAALSIVGRHYGRAQETGFRDFRLTVAMNVVTVVIQLVLLEGVARLLVRDSADGEVLLGRPLLPRSWERTSARYRAIIERGAGDLSYLVYDPGMGWTVGSGRHSSNGLYFSSREGLRAPRPDVAFGAAAPGKPRIALVGDSYTFGEEVRYEEAWATLLERELGGGSQVLNFGVPGYGVDQAYLRYEKDVHAWRPDLVALSFTSHDLIRSMTVYTALNFPEWDLPFSKPRLVLRDGRLETLNAPPFTPQEIFSKASVFDLPHLEYDPGFEPADWRPSVLDSSCAARFLRPWLRRWSPRPAVSPEARFAVNAAILGAFRASAAREGTPALIVFLPTRTELAGTPGNELGRHVLEAAALPFTDMASCVTAVPASDRFVPSGHHYSPRTNAAVAECLAPVVRSALASR